MTWPAVTAGAALAPDREGGEPCGVEAARTGRPSCTGWPSGVRSSTGFLGGVLGLGGAGRVLLEPLLRRCRACARLTSWLRSTGVPSGARSSTGALGRTGPVASVPFSVQIVSSALVYTDST